MSTTIEKTLHGVNLKINLSEESSRIGSITYDTKEPMVHSMLPLLLQDLFCTTEEEKKELSVLIDGRCAKYDIIISFGRGLHVIGDSISEEYEILDILKHHLPQIEGDKSTKIIYMVTDKDIDLKQLKKEVNEHITDEMIEGHNINILFNNLNSNGLNENK